MSPTMQRYMKAQAVASGQEDMLGGMGSMNQATLELNPTHPIIVQLKSMVETEPESEKTKSFGKLAYDVAALVGGYNIEDPSAFAARVTSLMTGNSDTPAESASTESETETETGEEVEAAEVATEIVDDE